ncbi:hypothetical protein WR25_05373 [Diploscapter pachys]|uniref:Hflx-type G domain-containing protein n=1 Tax=Diploscapter pachys TaxID=2018661 RepID=A0A2A2KA02_9BILA|nr:hypothetical protein WR25_05373 [Diploscapter pachys]
MRLCRVMRCISPSIRHVADGDGWMQTTSHDSGHNVLVIHPKIRWGKFSPSKLKDPQRQLDEAVTLVKTLPRFRVVQSEMIAVDYHTKKKTIWGRGNVQNIRKMAVENRATAVMVNIDSLTPMQQQGLYEEWNMPVYDRYNIVMEIFKFYAQTEEARLQIKLAEIPYIRNRLFFMLSSPCDPTILHVHKEDTNRSDFMEALRMREQKLRKKIEEVKAQNIERMEKQRNVYPLIAIVGYTNAGKTSLAKRLTGAESLVPKDRLFATLDTTRHFARLPSGRKICLTDTIGFLSDLPIHLIDAFEATLAHVKKADLIIHIRDISHPDWRAQSEDVERTLKSIGVENLEEQVITIDNKIDRPEADPEAEGDMQISCTTGEGMEELIGEIDKARNYLIIW